MGATLAEARAAAAAGRLALARGLFRRAIAADPTVVFEPLGLAGAMARHGRPCATFGLRVRQREHAWFNRTSLAIGRRHGCLAAPPADAPEGRWRCCPHWPRKYEADKLAMRALAVRCGVPVPALYHAGGDVGAIRFADLPERHVCKLSDGAGGDRVVLVQGDAATVVKTGATLPRAAVPDLLRRWHAERPRTQVMVEALLADEGEPDRRAVDCKLFVFGGRVTLLRVSDKRGGGQGSWCVRFLTRDWVEFPWPVRTGLTDDGRRLPRPRCLAALIGHAERLGEVIGGPVSVDMYATPDGPVLGEITNHPGNGNGFTPEGDRLLGELWEIFDGDGPAAPPFPCEVSTRDLVAELARRVRRRLGGR